MAVEEIPELPFGKGSILPRNACRCTESAIMKSPLVRQYWLRRMTGASRADALFMRKGSNSGLPVQLKAATSLGRRQHTYHFHRTLGYDGMLVLMVALDGDHIWASEGKDLHVKMLSITLGSASDTQRRVSNIESLLTTCFHDAATFPHLSVQEATFQCAPNHRVEARAHRGLAKLFSIVSDIRLCPPDVHQTTVDSFLQTENSCGRQWQVRMQEKALHVRRSHRFCTAMWKSGGALGRVAYDQSDFDLLAACILRDGQLQGVFLIPMSVLVQHGFAGCKAVNMPLYPPWAPPKRSRTKAKYAWQLDFVVDLRAWQASGEPSQALQAKLRDLVLQASPSLPESANNSA